MYQLQSLLVLDVETVSSSKSFDELPAAWQEMWVEKYSKTSLANLSPAESYSQRAAIHAEFGKVVCISTGIFYTDPEKGLCLRQKTIMNHDEKIVLEEFISLCDRFSAKHQPFLFAGHNIREFDIPYLGRRMMYHHIPLPSYFQLQGKKPWESQMIDTMELWKFGDYKNYTSLKLLTAVLRVPGSKDDMDGSLVGEVYYKENDLEKIGRYCSKDVTAVAQVLLRFKNLTLLKEANIEEVG